MVCGISTLYIPTVTRYTELRTLAIPATLQSYLHLLRYTSCRTVDALYSNTCKGRPVFRSGTGSAVQRDFRSGTGSANVQSLQYTQLKSLCSFGCRGLIRCQARRERFVSSVVVRPKILHCCGHTS